MYNQVMQQMTVCTDPYIIGMKREKWKGDRTEGGRAERVGRKRVESELRVVVGM